MSLYILNELMDKIVSYSVTFSINFDFLRKKVESINTPINQIINSEVEIKGGYGYDCWITGKANDRRS